MDEKEKQAYREGYQQAKKKGVPFFPDALFKDALISLLVFLILVGLAYFIGAPLEARANPADTSYTPRPEWYFLFLFQLLKKFPGNLEVLSVVVLPTLAILVLFVLPFLDRSPRRDFRSRPAVIGTTAVVFAGIIFLTFQAYRETPPPAEAAQGDQIAALYAKNCAGCHGSTIKVAAGTNLHAIIAQGKHEGMPAWSGDLTSDQIDALAGFILSPGGSQLFTDNCGECHQAPELVAGSPVQLKNALDQGKDFQPHATVQVPQWNQILNQEQLSELLNFLAAPDGQRLFETNCSPCHGKSVAFSGNEADLQTLISQGGLHLEMPPWQGRLNDGELDTLANYVVNPSANSGGQALFKQHCAVCHGERIPTADDFTQARQVIASGGPHQTMPVWGDGLTPDQLTALVDYTLSAASGAPLALGQELFAKNCAPCHGDFGEGGLNPAVPGDIIAPISTAEFLKTRDDFTLRSVISQGQPNFGMSPFGSSFGGPLDDEEIDAIVAYLRSWEANPPVELPPEVQTNVVTLNGVDIYKNLCSQCHGLEGEGGVGPALNGPKFQDQNSDQEIFDTINNGHKATTMIAWGEILTADQIQQVVKYIRQLRVEETTQPTTTTTKAVTATKTAPATPTPAGPPTFTDDVLPIFEAKCTMCHGSSGGWDGSNYQSAINSGDNGPVVIPGDVDNSLLTQKLLGTQEEGSIMPPLGTLAEDQIQIILDWIAGGAMEK